MDSKKYHLALTRPGYASLLADELRDRFDLVAETVAPAAVALAEKSKLPPLDQTIFVRQYLPNAALFKGEGLDDAAAFILKRLEITTNRANRQTGRWTLHAFAIDDDPALERAGKLEKAVLAGVKAKLARFHKRYIDPAEMTKEPRSDDDLVVQIFVPGPDELWLSVATVASGVSPYIAGNRRMRAPEGAPSRSARKLEEAFVTLGREPKDSEIAVDLGAAPGGWTFVLASHGAAVTAVDHADLAIPETKKRLGKITHLRENGLKYAPVVPVDWLCCDMVIASRETLRVLGDWLEADRMRYFVVNVKLPGADAWPVIKEALALLAAHPWAVMRAKHLYHDRREITLMGQKLPEGDGA